MQYIAIVHKDEDSAYGVTFPDLDGCFAAADTEEELLSKAIEALDLYFEDGDIVAPHPNSISSIRSRFGDDLAEGAFLISVPWIPRSTKQVRANISLDAGTLAAIDAAAEALGLSRSAFVVQATRNEIRQPDRGGKVAA